MSKLLRVMRSTIRSSTLLPSKYSKDTLFSKKKYSNLIFLKNGGWHFTCLKKPEELEKKLLNFAHHYEFELSGIKINDIKKLLKREKKNIYSDINYKCKKWVNEIDTKILEKFDKNGKIYTIDLNDVFDNCIKSSELKRPININECIEEWKSISDKYINFLKGDSKEIMKNLDNSLDRINFAFLDGSHLYKDLKKELELHKPDSVISFIGRTHGTIDDKVYSTIDHLEQKGKIYDKINNSKPNILTDTIIINIILTVSSIL